MTSSFHKGDWTIVPGIRVSQMCVFPCESETGWGSLWELVFDNYREAEMRDTHLSEEEALALLRLAGHEEE